MVDFLSSSQGRDLDDAQSRLANLINGGIQSAPPSFDDDTLTKLEDIAIKHDVPVDILAAISEQDIERNPRLARYIGADANRNANLIRRRMEGGMSVEEAVRSIRASASPEDQADFAQSVLSRTKRIRDNYWGSSGATPEQEPSGATPTQSPSPSTPAHIETPKATIGDNTSDATTNLAIGVNAAVRDMNELAHRILPEKVTQFADWADKSIGSKAMEERGKEIEERLKARLSPKMRESLERKWWDSDKGELGDAWTDWRSYAGPLLQSLPETVATSLPALRLAKSVYGARVAAGASAAEAAAHAATAATVAGAVSEGALGGASTARSVRDEIESLPVETLRKSDAFKALVRSGVSEAKARETLARDQSARAFIVGGVVTGAFGGMGDRVIAKTFLDGMGEQGWKAIAAKIGKSAVGEGLFEEAPQSALQRVAENEAIQAADPSRSLSDDVVNQALGGAAVGGLMGAGMGGAFHHATREAAAQPQTAASSLAAEAAPAPSPAPGVEGSVEFAPAPAEVPEGPLPRSVANGAAPQAEAPAGPLSRALVAGAPHVAPAAQPAGQRVVLSDETGELAGFVVAQDADGFLFKSDDGDELLVPHSDIASGAVRIDPEAASSESLPDQSAAGRTPAVDAPNPFPAPAEATDEISPFAAPDAPPTSEQAVPVSNLEVDPARADRKTKPSSPSGGATAAPSRPAPSRAEGSSSGRPYLAAEDGAPFRSREEARNAIVGIGERPGDFLVEPAVIGGGFFAVRKPRSGAEGVRKVAPAQPDRALSDMSEPELRERMKFLAQQAKAGGGWNKTLSVARRKVEAEIDKRNGLGARQAGLTEKPAAPAVSDAKRAEAIERLKRDPSGWGARAAAQSFVDNNGLGETHEVTQKGKKFAVVEKAKPAEGFEKFSAESGTLGIPRSEMPQVPTQAHGGLVRHLNAQGVAHETKEVATEDLKPTQAEFSPEKVAAAREAEGDRSIIVSNDGHVIDGHHQWLAAKENDEPVKAIVLDAPVEKALEAVKNSPSANDVDGERLAKFSIADDGGDKRLGEIATKLGEVDDLFQNPRAQGRSPQAVIKEVDPTIKFVGNVTAPDEASESGADRKLAFETKKGHRFYAYEEGDRLWLDVSRLDEGEGGSAIYAALFDYAHNAEKVFIGDPAGLSDIALRRRTEAMLSSALKHGTTAHMEPHERQLVGEKSLGVPPLKWQHGRHADNIESLINASVESLAHYAPEIRDARYDFETGAFRDEEGIQIPDSGFDRWSAKLRGIGEAGAGRATLKRGVFLNSLAREKSGERSRLLESFIRQQSELVGQARGVFYSAGDKARSGGLTAPQLASVLKSGRDGDVIAKLLGSGKVRLHDDATTLPAGVGHPSGAVQGVAALDGRIHLVASNLSPDNARAVLLHEVFHSGGEPLIGSRQWKALLSHVRTAAQAAQARAKAGQRSPSDRFWTDALARASRAPTAHLAEEIAAYAIEHRESAPTGLREIADNLIGAVKAFILRKFGRQLGDVTPGQLRALALAALRTWDAPALAGGKPRYSVASDGAAETARTPLFAKAKNALHDFVTNAIAGKVTPLALTPVRPLFLELAANLPSAKSYLRTKEAMDALRNNLSNEVSPIVEKWGTLALRFKADNRALSDLMHDSTIAQIDPSKPSKFASDNPRHAEYLELRKRYNALPKIAKELYSEVRDLYEKRADESEKEVIANMRRAIDAAVKRAEREHTAELQRIKDKGLTGKERDDAIADADHKLKLAQNRTKRMRAARLKRLRQQFESNRLNGPYFPLSRFGQFFVTVRDEDGKVVSFSRFESASEQRAFADEMRKDKENKVEVGLLEEKTKAEAFLDPKFVADVDAILEAGHASTTRRDQVWQRYLETLPDLSMRKSRIHRKGRAGYSTDALRAFASSMFHSAHQISRLRHGLELGEHLEEAGREVKNAKDPVRSGAVFNEMRKAHDFTMNPDVATWSQNVTSAVFTWTMAANVSSALVNLDQTISKGIPVLAFDEGTGSVGMRGASAHLANAFVDFMRGKGYISNSASLTADERDSIAKSYERGVIDKTQAHDLAGVAERGASYNPLWAKFTKLASAPLHHTERLNREVTFLAAYRIARDAKLTHEQAIVKAGDLTWMTHYDNQASSKARFMRASGPRAIFALKSFQANVLFRVFRDLQQSLKGATPGERKAALGRFVSTLALTLPMAGVKGAFGYGLLMSIAGFFMGLAGNDDDPEEALRKAVLETAGDGVIGHAVGGMLMDGIPGYLTGTSISERVGMGDLWFRSNNRDLNAEQQFVYVLEQLGGAPIGLAHQVWQGADAIQKGNLARGVERVSPAFIRNAVKAGRYAREGVRDKDGNPVVEHVSLPDVLKQLIGFTPAEVAERYERNTFQRNAQDRIRKERSAIVRDAGQARRDGEDDSTAREKIDRFNERYPERRIAPKDIQSWIKRQSRRGERMEYGVDLDPKLAERVKDRTAPAIYGR